MKWANQLVGIILPAQGVHLERAQDYIMYSLENKESDDSEDNSKQRQHHTNNRDDL